MLVRILHHFYVLFSFLLLFYQLLVLLQGHNFHLLVSQPVHFFIQFQYLLLFVNTHFDGVFHNLRLLFFYFSFFKFFDVVFVQVFLNHLFTYLQMSLFIKQHLSLFDPCLFIVGLPHFNLLKSSYSFLLVLFLYMSFVISLDHRIPHA